MVESMRKVGENVKIETEQHNPAAVGRTGYSLAGPKPLVRVPRSSKTADLSLPPGKVESVVCEQFRLPALVEQPLVHCRVGVGVEVGVVTD